MTPRGDADAPILAPRGANQALSKLCAVVSRGRARISELQRESQAWIARKRQEIKVRLRVLKVSHHFFFFFRAENCLVEVQLTAFMLQSLRTTAFTVAFNTILLLLFFVFESVSFTVSGYGAKAQ